MKKLFSLIVLVSVISFAQEKYVGVGYQKNIQESWKIEVVKISLNTYNVNYPDSECSGVWTVLEAGETYFMAKETITEGRDKCIDGYVKIYDDFKSKDAKRFYFYDERNSLEPSSLGVLVLEE